MEDYSDPNKLYKDPDLDKFRNVIEPVTPVIPDYGDNSSVNPNFNAVTATMQGAVPGLRTNPNPLYMDADLNKFKNEPVIPEDVPAPPISSDVVKQEPLFRGILPEARNAMSAFSEGTGSNLSGELQRYYGSAIDSYKGLVEDLIQKSKDPSLATSTRQGLATAISGLFNSIARGHELGGIEAAKTGIEASKARGEVGKAYTEMALKPGETEANAEYMRGLGSEYRRAATAGPQTFEQTKEIKAMEHPPKEANKSYLGEAYRNLMVKEIEAIHSGTLDETEIAAAEERLAKYEKTLQKMNTKQNVDAAIQQRIEQSQRSGIPREQIETNLRQKGIDPTKYRWQ